MNWREQFKKENPSAKRVVEKFAISAQMLGCGLVLGSLNPNRWWGIGFLLAGGLGLLISIFLKEKQ